MEETLNELLEAEAEKLTQAALYERTEAAWVTAAATTTETLTTSWDVTLYMLRLKGACLSKRLSSNGTATGRAEWKKPSLGL